MTIMSQEPGTIVFPVRNSNGHNYILGKAYVVTYIDDDGTFKCRDAETGVEGNWIKWEDVSLSPPLGWIWLKKQLPPNVVSILSLFDGVNNLILKEEYKDLLLQELPDLMSRLEVVGDKLLKDQAANSQAMGKNAGNILSFPKNQPDLDSESVEMIDGMEFDDEYYDDDDDDDTEGIQEFLDLFHGEEKPTKNELENFKKGKDSRGNNLPDDD